jgi:hypothetical protein
MTDLWGASDDEEEWEDGFVQEEEVAEDEEEDEQMDVMAPIADIELDLAGDDCNGSEGSEEADSSSTAQAQEQGQLKNSKKRRYASGAVSEADREEALTWHRVHLLCLVARAQLVHRWTTGTPANDSQSTLNGSTYDYHNDADAGAAAEARALVLSCMPPGLMAEVSTALENAAQRSAPGALPHSTLAAISTWFASMFPSRGNSHRTSSSSASYATDVDPGLLQHDALSSPKEKLPPAAFACLSCASCGVSRREVAANLGACKTCRRAYYCSKACQAAHWRTGGHRDLCRRPRTSSRNSCRGRSSSTLLQSELPGSGNSSRRKRPVVDNGGTAGSHPGVLLNRLKAKMTTSSSTTDGWCTRHELAQVLSIRSCKQMKRYVLSLFFIVSHATPLLCIGLCHCT